VNCFVLYTITASLEYHRSPCFEFHLFSAKKLKINRELEWSLNTSDVSRQPMRNLTKKRQDLQLTWDFPFGNAVNFFSQCMRYNKIISRWKAIDPCPNKEIMWLEKEFYNRRRIVFGSGLEAFSPWNKHVFVDCLPFSQRLSSFFFFLRDNTTGNKLDLFLRRWSQWACLVNRQLFYSFTSILIRTKET